MSGLSKIGTAALRLNKSRAFLIEDPARVGLKAGESLTQLNQPGNWKHLAPKDGNKIVHNIHIETKDTISQKKPMTRQDFVEPYLESYGKYKTYIFGGVWAVVLLPYCLGAYFLNRADD